MPAPRLTPAQKTFGIGLLPEYELFRPPEGMEFDPAYSNFTRQQQGLAAESQLQRQAFQQQRDELRRNQEVLAAEDDAIAAMKERPDEIPNILRSFPELARSRNLGGVLDYARAVTPSAAQKTLTPSIRKSLKPDEVAHFDRLIQENPDPVEAKLGAERMAAHETNLADMLSKGVPLSTIEQFRNRPLGPLERAAIVNEHTRKSDWSPEQKALLEGAMRDIDNNYAPAQGESALDVAMNKSKLKQQLIAAMLPKSTGQQPPAIATPAAEGGNVASAPVAPISSVVPGMGGNTVLPEVQKLPPHHYVQEINAIDTSNPVSAKILADLTEAGDLPIEAKRAAVAKLGKVVESPPDFGQLSLREIAETKHQLSTAYEKAKNSLQMDEIIEKDVKPAWTKAKSDMEKLVDAFAAKNKVSPISVYRSIASGEYIPSLNEKGIVVGEVPASVAILGDQYMTENPHLKSVSAQVERMHNKESPIFARINRFLGGEKVVNGDVLNELAQEKAKPVASATPAGRVAPKIEIGKPTPVK